MSNHSKKFTYQETSTILAALRLLQEQIQEQGADSVSHMPHFDDIEPLTTDQIEKLCEKFHS